MTPPSRCGFVAIVGAPNAGKSTLMNRLTGAKLSIVSPKAQTTRFRVLGILMRAESQVLLVDTPGIFKPKRKLDRAMVAAAWSGAADADVAMLMVDARSGLREDVRQIAAQLGASGRRCWLVLNKVDLVEPPSLLPLTAALTALAAFEETFMVSAQTGEGIRALADALANVVPEGPWLYPEDDLTDLPDRLLAAETVREQIFLQTHEEVPYGATVETKSFKERKDGSVRIEVTIYVARPGHKAILIGDKGSKIKAIGARARQDLGGLLDRPVHLFLNVKERKGWDEEGARLRAIGLEDPGRGEGYGRPRNDSDDGRHWRGPVTPAVMAACVTAGDRPSGIRERPASTRGSPCCRPSGRRCVQLARRHLRGVRPAARCCQTRSRTAHPTCRRRAQAPGGTGPGRRKGHPMGRRVQSSGDA